MDTTANHHTGQVRPRLKRAVRLAWEGHLTSVEYMDIRDMNIKNIPRGHMEKLASIVTRRVWMTQADQLGGILARVKCPVLCLRDMELSEVETRALVTAMKERVQRVRLWGVTLDIEELTKLLDVDRGAG